MALNMEFFALIIEGAKISLSIFFIGNWDFNYDARIDPKHNQANHHEVDDIHLKTILLFLQILYQPCF